MEMDIVQRLRCVLKGNQDAQAAADEIKRLRAALHELADKTGELIEHLQATGRMSPCFNLPALDAARRALTPNTELCGARRASERAPG